MAESVGKKMGGGYDTFIQAMNDESEKLGCTGSHWTNANGLHDEQHYTTALIILATMFLKQHSVLDVFGAVIMAYVLYKVVYEPEKKMIPQLSKQKFSKQKRIAAHNK